MNAMAREKALVLAPFGVAAIGLLVITWWLMRGPPMSLAPRLPGADRATGSEGAGSTNAVLAGRLVKGSGTPANLPGSWTGFRGNGRDGIEHSGSSSAPTGASSHMPLSRTWDSSGPRELWTTDVGEGYAGAAVAQGRVYLMDYDRERKEDALRCLSLADGKEIWRYAYPVSVKRNHGMSRTVPAVAGDYVVAMGPKCHVVCVDAATGELRWGLDLVRDFGATVPPWYAGQCPLVENQQVILAPGGKDALLIAVELATGRPVWQTPNPKGWKMTHSSVMPMDVAGQRTYVYCATLGAVGVSAKDGTFLWETSDWKISIATVPSPLVLDGQRVFFTGGYNAGSLVLQLAQDGGRIVPKTALKLDAETFGATQHTPVLWEGHLFGVRADGQFVCLDPDGKVLWASGAGHTFGLGSFLLADGLIFALNDSGTLSLIEATPEKFVLLGQAPVLKGHESWAPMCLVNGRLLARDLTHLVCLDVAARN
jgi:outer membrane protein assembly factor BamB